MLWEPPTLCVSPFMLLLLSPVAFGELSCILFLKLNKLLNSQNAKFTNNCSHRSLHFKESWERKAMIYQLNSFLHVSFLTSQWAVLDWWFGTGFSSLSSLYLWHQAHLLCCNYCEAACFMIAISLDKLHKEISPALFPTVAQNQDLWWVCLVTAQMCSMWCCFSVTVISYHFLRLCGKDIFLRIKGELSQILAQFVVSLTN